jgi:hypothetical protein
MKYQNGFAEVLMVAMAIIGFLGVFFGGIMIIGHFYGKYQCANYQDITGKETRFAAFDICYIKTADGWQRWDEYTKRAAASEGLKGIGK